MAPIRMHQGRIQFLTYVASKIGVTEAKAYSVATFYENFSFEPKGKYVIKVCDGTACHVRKSMPVKGKVLIESGYTVSLCFCNSNLGCNIRQKLSRKITVLCLDILHDWDQWCRFRSVMLDDLICLRVINRITEKIFSST